VAARAVAGFALVVAGLAACGDGEKTAEDTKN
jgi:hypothetical protein